MAADWGGRRAAAAATGSVGGKATPTGDNVEVVNGTPRRRPPRSDNIDSPDGHLGGTDDTVDPREGHRGLTINSLKYKRKLVDKRYIPIDK